MLPVLPVILPLFAAALLAALTKLISSRVSQWIALAVSLATLVADGLLLRLSAEQPVVYWLGNWRPRDGIALGISFVAEPFGASLAALAALLTLAALVFSSQYFDTAGNYFHALLLGFLAAMSGFCLTGDLFNMFVFFELMSAAAFALCGYKTDDPASLQGALNFAVTNTIGAFFVLTGIGLLYARSGALNMALMGRALEAGPPDSLVLVGFAFLVCGYLVKAAVVPFHFWLADAHAVAPTPVCILFSGVMVEMGLYALARIWWAVFAGVFRAHWSGLSALFLTAGVLTAITGAVMCYIQRNMKRLLAFSTISHMGLMVIGIGLWKPEGLAGVGIYVLGHGMVKASLFLVAGMLLHRFQSVDEYDLRGVARGERVPAVIFLAGAVALAGSPGSGLDAGHSLLEAAAENAGKAWLQWVSLFAGVVTSAAVLRAGGRVFFGWGHPHEQADAPRQEEKPETNRGRHHTPISMLIPAGVLAAAGLLFGLLPGMKPAAARAAMNFVNTGAYAAHVLEGQAYRATRPDFAIPKDALTGLGAISAALLIAGVHLFRPRPRRAKKGTPAVLDFLHRLHSGNLADYVTFLTFGVACFALVCAYCFQ